MFLQAKRLSRQVRSQYPKREHHAGSPLFRQAVPSIVSEPAQWIHCLPSSRGEDVLPITSDRNAIIDRNAFGSRRYRHETGVNQTYLGFSKSVVHGAAPASRFNSCE